MSQKRVEKKAEVVLDEWGGKKAPVDIEAIVKSRGLELVKEDLEDDVSGFLVRKEGKNYIGVNANHHPNRQRFTIAHELGHFLLHMSADKELFIDATYYRNNLSSKGEHKDEIEANSFAAVTLMPSKFIEDELSDLDGELDDLRIFRLANKFKVSDQAMKFRLANLGLIII